MNRDPLQVRYILNEAVAIEDFNEQSLIFLARERRVTRINLVTRTLLGYLDGKKTVEDILCKSAPMFDVPMETFLRDGLEIFEDLKMKRILRDADVMEKIEEIMATDNTVYSINYDISCRIEEPEGAILFNPETDAVTVINPIGLAIWQALEYPRRKAQIIEHLLDICDDAPVEQVSKDVDEFVDKLVATGFIGKVVE